MNSVSCKMMFLHSLTRYVVAIDVYCKLFLSAIHIRDVQMKFHIG
jgi:hypothetical protein